MSAAAATTLSPLPSLQDTLKHTILLADRLHKTATEAAESSTPECAEIAAQAATIAAALRSVHRVVVSSAGGQGVYEVPMRRVLVEVERNLEKGLGLVKRKVGGRSAGFLVRKVFSMSAVEKVSSLLESSIADLSWLLSIYESDVPNLGLPPIVQHCEPILAWVWSHIAMLEPGRDMKARIGSVNDLAQLAMNARNKQLIVEQGAVPRLLKLLKDSGVNGSVEAQVAAANALLNVVYCKESVRVIANEGGISLIAGVLGESVTKVQVVVAKLVARMAEEDQVVREEFGNINVMKPLVSCLLLDLASDHYAVDGGGKASWQSLVQMNKELGSKNGMHPIHHDYHKVYSSASLLDGSSRGSNGRKERENEAPEVKYQLKTNCALTLWRLCAGSLLNSRKIAEGNWLLFLAKIIENENGELRLNCLMAVMEIATVAETNPELRKAAWKPSLVPAKAVLDQLLRVIKEEDDPVLQIPAIKAIGCLARTFPAKETGILAPLVAQVGNSDSSVATEAAIALGKFVCPGNFNHVEHSKAIIEFKGVQLLMKMLKVNERAQNPDVKDMFAGAIHSLAIYQATVHPHGHSYAIV